MKPFVKALVVSIVVTLLFCTLQCVFAAEDINEQTPTETLREAVRSGDAEAQYQLAQRLLADKAHSPEATRILWDAENDVRNAANVNNRQLLKEKEQQLQQLKAVFAKKESKEALELLESAVTKKHINSMLKLAWLCEMGKDLERSFELNRQAAELGTKEAMSNIGICYAEGKGVPKDVKEAVKWFEAAYALGYHKAGFHLATILVAGGLNGHDDGWPKDNQRAYALGRAIQLTSYSGTPANQWGSEIVATARKHLDVEQLLAAETEAEKEAERLKGVLGLGVKATSDKPAANLITPKETASESKKPPQPRDTSPKATPDYPMKDVAAPENQVENTKKSTEMTKEEWKKRLNGRLQVSPGGLITVAITDFLKICGEPQKTETARVGNGVFWYYECKDGTIQVDVHAGPLLGVGMINAYVKDYVAIGSAPENQVENTKKSTEMTKEEWKKRLGKTQPLFRQSGQLMVPKAVFLKICGNPQKTQSVENDVFWYYECADGTIQVHINKDLLGFGGMISGTVNDY